MRRVVAHWTIGTGRELRVYTAQMYLDIFGSEYSWTLYRDVRLEFYRIAPKNWLQDGRLCGSTRKPVDDPKNQRKLTLQSRQMHCICMGGCGFRHSAAYIRPLQEEQSNVFPGGLFLYAGIFSDLYGYRLVRHGVLLHQNSSPDVDRTGVAEVHKEQYDVKDTVRREGCLRRLALARQGLSSPKL